MNKTEKEIIEWNSSKKQNAYLESGDVRECLKDAQKQFILRAVLLAIQGVAFGSLAFREFRAQAESPSELQELMASLFAFLGVVSGGQFGYHLARSQFKEKLLQEMIGAGAPDESEKARS